MLLVVAMERLAVVMVLLPVVALARAGLPIPLVRAGLVVGFRLNLVQQRAVAVGFLRNLVRRQVVVAVPVRVAPGWARSSLCLSRYQAGNIFWLSSKTMD